MPTPFELTIEKLTKIKTEIFGTPEDQKEAARKLRSYSECWYCKAYRTTLSGHPDGCCNRCPIHLAGERRMGRKHQYNGCYLFGSYRNMVKSAFWFNENPSQQAAETMAKAVDETIAEMNLIRNEIDEFYGESHE